MTTTEKHMTTIPARHVSFWIPRVLQALAWIPTRLLLNYFCHFEVRGLENVLRYKNQPILFIANHASELDPIAIRAALPLFWNNAPLCYVTAPLKVFADKAFSWRSALYSSRWFFPSWGAYPAVSGTGSYAKALELHAHFMNTNGSCFLIFPEGRRVKEGVVSKIHGGAGYLASLPDVITIPVLVDGFANTSLKSFTMRQHQARVCFGIGNPFERRATASTSDSYKRFASQVVKTIYALSDDKS